MDIYCSVCGSLFTPKDREQRLCSWRCRGKWVANVRPPRELAERPCSKCGRTIQSKGRNLAYCAECIAGPEWTCRQCGTTFRSSRPRIFCSVACRNRYSGQHAPTGSDHPNWRGGRLYHTHAWHLARDAARNRDGWRCMDCGHVRPEIKRLHAHHLVSRADWGDRPGHADDLANLVTLCTGCHRKRHPIPTSSRHAGWIKRRAATIT